MLEHKLKQMILDKTNAKEAWFIEEVQNLWGGYGKIVRIGLEGSSQQNLILKKVSWPKKSRHPLGWNTDLSHERKLKSYQVETKWYLDYSHLCVDACRVPKAIAVYASEDEVNIVLEDLNEVGYTQQKTSVCEIEMKTCITWLANFHACFIHQEPLGLWPIGTYWHLETRPDELARLEDEPLKQAAKLIDQKLNQSPYLTIVHGDAKLENFCFSKSGHQVAAVDFQYVGGGCGMKDLAYFIGSCLNERQCEKQEKKWLEVYFTVLKQALAQNNKGVDANALEKNWRELYPVACTDFHRFLKGWSPGHWKLNGYNERMSKRVIEQLNAAI